VLATQQTLEVRNLGTGTLVIDQVASSEPWLTSQPISVDANALGSYAVNVNRTGLDDGSYSGTLTFIPADSAVNSVSIAVVMQVSTANVEANAGLHYIILVNEAGETVGIPGVQAVDAGRYEFSLPDIPPGEYRLFAGSDMDDDAFLCDSGEACGAYRTLDAPETIVVDPALATEISGLNLVSEFRTVITTPAGATASAATSNGIRVFKPQPTPQPVREPKQR